MEKVNRNRKVRNTWQLQLRKRYVQLKNVPFHQRFYQRWMS